MEQKLNYHPTLDELMDFVSPDGHHGFSQLAVAQAEERLGVSFPPAYRRFLLQYGADPVNDLLHHINPPQEITTTYALLEEELEDWRPEFEQAERVGDGAKYADDELFALWKLPREQWEAVTDNYVLLWYENQGVWNAGFRLADLQAGVQDPPVYVSTNDDFITFAPTYAHVEEFLWEMLREAAYETGSFARKPEEIQALLSASGVELEAMLVPCTSPTGFSYQMGTCLDPVRERLYFYYGQADYEELTVVVKVREDGSMDFTCKAYYQ